MPEKPKITIKELKDIYDIEEEPKEETKDEWEITISEGDKKIEEEFE